MSKSKVRSRGRQSQSSNSSNSDDDLDGVHFEVKCCLAYELILRFANQLKFPYVNDKKLICGEKVNTDSVQLRIYGNDYYRSPGRALNFQVAQQMFTQSISAATPNSLELAQAYANRANVLFVRKHYKECLQDIDRALEISVYPKENHPKLLELKKKVLEKVPSRKKPFLYHEPVPMLANPSPENPAVAVFLEVKENADWGRHVVATRDIEPGEILLIEDPYACDLVELTNYWFCTECLEMCFNLIPCDGCRVVMFCSKECKDKAHAAYHKYECQAMQGDAKIEYLNLRVTFRCLTERTDKKSKVFSKQYEQVKQIKLQYLEQHGGERENIIKKVSIIFDVLCMKATNPNVQKEMIFPEQNLVHFMKQVMYHNYLVCLENPTEITNYHTKQRRHIVMGRGIFPFFSNFNHSCVNNVGYTFYGKKLVAIAVKKIKKGEQCFVNYKKYSPYKDAKKDRQEFLKKNYYFTCRCKACEEDWPLGKNLSLNAKSDIGRQLLSFKVEEIYKMVESGAISLLDETAKQELLKECFELSAKLKAYEPCVELDYLRIIFDELLLRGNFNPVDF